MIREPCAYKGRDDSRVTGLPVPSFNFGPKEFLGWPSLGHLEGEQSKKLTCPGVFSFPLHGTHNWRLAGTTVPTGTWGLE